MLQTPIFGPTSSASTPPASPHLIHRRSNDQCTNSSLWANPCCRCYGPEYVEHEDVIDYFETAIMYHQKVPTWDWLSDADITPSNSTTYTLADMQAALTMQWGATPYIGCSGPRYNTTTAGNGTTDRGRTVVSELWYYMHVSSALPYLLSHMLICIGLWKTSGRSICSGNRERAQLELCHFRRCSSLL